MYGITVVSFHPEVNISPLDGPPSPASEGPRPEDVAIIRELYQGSQDQERFEVELERALDARCHTIVIEPARLGDETAR